MAFAALLKIVMMTAAVGAKAGSGPALALTFDDGPDVAHRGTDAIAESDAILAALAAAKVKSVLFVAGKRVDSPEGLAAVAAWGKAGHLVANHSYAHGNLSAVATTVADFEADVLRNEALLRKLPGFSRVFRYPFLKEGETAEKRDEFRAYLRKRGYRQGRATIDASDWYYDERFRAWRAAHPQGDPTPFRDAYLAHLWGRAQYYEALAKTTVGRSIKHTLILHTNAVNAAFLPDVIRMFRERGWTVIDAARAFRDPIFAADPKVLPSGESLIWALAKAKGVPDLRYPGEGSAYEKPILDAAGL